MAFEDKLLSKCIQTGSVEKLISFGIEDRHFADFQSKEVWKFLGEHTRKYGSSPSLETFKENFPEYKLDISTEPIEFLKDKFVAEVKRRETESFLYDIGEILEKSEIDELENIDEIVLARAQDLSNIVPASNLGKFSNMKERIAEYRRKQEEGEPPGILTGIRTLDEHTLGIQPHELVVVAGSTGVGKSSYGFQACVTHYMDGLSPLIISLEMSDEECFRKMDGIAAGLKQLALKRLDLDPNDMKRWEKLAERSEKAANDINIVDVNNATPEKIYAEAARYRPDIIMVDYVQLLTAPKHIQAQHEKVSHCVQELKKLARQLKIPVYGLAQTNADGFEAGAELHNLGQSRDIGRHSDIVLGLAQTKDQREINMLDLRVLKNRGGSGVGTQIPMKWDHANSVYEEAKEIDFYPLKEKPKELAGSFPVVDKETGETE